ncbi:hypothetical protein Gorai_015747 [Gossypium raimondii]|uniref:Uncharacterized protein n=1 Tax=Gossypium raimondii TaxID=29730 RepID=A0A7J8P6Z6_GOSRA|nr:hypothetical protein [Gossypium raimondii]
MSVIWGFTCCSLLRLSKRPAPICCQTFCVTTSIIYLKSSQSFTVTPSARLSGQIWKRVDYYYVKQLPWLCENASIS